VAVDATTLEANAAMRTIVRRATGQRYEEYLKQLAAAAGIENPTREQLARFDRKRKNKASNRDWKHPYDPDARITKMKDGRTHLAHKAEHAVDLSSGALVAVTLQPADEGDTTTIQQTLAEAQQAAQGVNERGVEEAVADKGVPQRGGVEADRWTGHPERTSRNRSGDDAIGRASETNSSKSMRTGGGCAVSEANGYRSSAASWPSEASPTCMRPAA